MQEWRRAEPGNTSGIGTQPGEDTSNVHAVFVKGDFTIVGPPSDVSPGSSMMSSYDEGRIVFDDTGEVLGVSLWSAADAVPPKSTGDPAFGPAFDDS